MKFVLVPAVQKLTEILFGGLTLNEVSSWLMNASVWALLGIGTPLALFLLWLCARYIPHNRVGVVEKLWSGRGSLGEGRIIALNGEAGYQAKLLRGGLHFGYWRWQYRIHKTRLVTIPQSEIGYVYARDGEPLSPSQTLGRVVPSNNVQDAAVFLDPGTEHPRGQRGRQRAILREGVYAINPALFVIITNSDVFALLQVQEPHERKAVSQWQEELRGVNGFQPIVIGRHSVSSEAASTDSAANDDNVGIVTIHDGPSLPTGELIAPPVGGDALHGHDHNNFQDPEAFLAAGGRRGRQYQTLTDGTYFINRWFASVETIPKTVVPIGHVGVVVSYYGRTGLDLSGTAFRHGEQVAEGERGVWERPLGPGKYAFNTYAGNIVLVPTTNFVLHWITGRTETHRYDENLRSIDLVTRDAYEPSLPLSVVVHIDYQRAPSVIQRFGDVKKLITQTLDPLLSAYFRDIAHKQTMLELLHERDVIQRAAQAELKRRFHEFDIECVDVLIGKPDAAGDDGKIESLLEQLRMRQLSIEQLETYERQREANDKLRTLNEAKAQAEMQTSLTNAKLQVQIAESKGDAEVALAKRQNDRAIMVTQTELTNTRLKVQMAECEGDAEVARAERHANQVRLLAEADSQKSRLAGRGEAQRILQEGLAEASVLQRKIASYGDPRLFALTFASRELAHATQPLVPERLFTMAGNSDKDSLGPQSGMLGTLLSLLVAERAGFSPTVGADQPELKEMIDQLTRDSLDALREPARADSDRAASA
ncbi:MAG: SPFH domain-containing protein [Planctomycetota bacterium]